RARDVFPLARLLELHADFVSISGKAAQLIVAIREDRLEANSDLLRNFVHRTLGCGEYVDDRLTYPALIVQKVGHLRPIALAQRHFGLSAERLKLIQQRRNGFVEPRRLRQWMQCRLPSVPRSPAACAIP